MPSCDRVFAMDNRTIAVPSRDLSETTPRPSSPIRCPVAAHQLRADCHSSAKKHCAQVLDRRAFAGQDSYYGARLGFDNVS